MAKLYYNLVNTGAWKIENVPALWRKQVEDMLNSTETTSDTQPMKARTK